MSAVEGGGADAAEEKVNDKPLATGVTVIGPTTPSPVIIGLMLMLLKVSVPTVHENPGAV